MTEANVVRAQLAETVVPSRRLGRHVNHDPRSRNFEATRAPQVTSVDHQASGLPLNQGTIGSCTANALCGALNSAPDNSAPNRAPGKTYGESDAVSLYGLETKLEGQPYPPNDPGGSGLMVCKAAKQLGWISSYKHAFGLQHALEALVLRPVITGIGWYTSFDTPDANGLVAIAASATVRGGHEVVADGIDADNQLVWFWNSWGTVYAKGGRFCMSYTTWDQLLSEQGDVTVPLP
jgi:hypothetical protein